MVVPLWRKVAEIAFTKRSLKRIHAGEKGEIVEVFHSAVEETERRQRFQFLSDDRLFGIGAEHGRREIQQAWVLNVRGSVLPIVAAFGAMFVSFASDFTKTLRARGSRG